MISKRSVAVLLIVCAALAATATIHEFNPDITGLVVYEGLPEISPKIGPIKQSIAEFILSTAIRVGNEPFFLDTGNRTVVLALHGLGASPWEVREAAGYLENQFISVYAPLMEGHGTTPELLQATKWQEWYARAEQDLIMLENYSTNIFIMGVSTGADIAILLARNHPNVKGIILVSPALYLKDWKTRYIGILRYFIKYVKTSLDKTERFYYYDRKPVDSVYQLMKMAKSVKKILPEVHTPVIIFQSHEDGTVKPEGAQYIYDNIGSEDRELFWFDEGSHVLVRDERAMDELFERTHDFIMRHS